MMSNCRYLLWCVPFLLTLACRTERAERAADTTVSWVNGTLADSGFGPIVVGMTPQEANAAVGGSLHLPQGLGTEGCDYAVAPGVEGLGFMIENGRIVRIDVRARAVRTAEGAGIGDTEDRIQKVYSGRVVVSPHKYTDGHYLTIGARQIALGAVQLIFETDGRVVTRFRAGLLPQVAYVEGCG